MTGRNRIITWAMAGTAGAALITFFVLIGLDRADKIASTVSAVIAVLGGGAAVVAARADRPAPVPPGQVVQSSWIGGDIRQVSRVRGDIRTTGGPTAPRPARRPREQGVPDAPPAGQRVADSTTGGPVHQIDDIGGDVEIER
ncbi:hypothetical protein [Actinoplanes sp. NPDC051494]|uniref:hypothetical protein n=1 Tax=Actinoplanes sp. NPDC051494 TaxID=3363907 RepID=UPI0037991B0E